MAKEFDYPTYDAGGRVEKYKEGGKVDVTDVVKEVIKQNIPLEEKSLKKAVKKSTEFRKKVPKYRDAKTESGRRAAPEWMIQGTIKDHDANIKEARKRVHESKNAIKSKVKLAMKSKKKG